MYQLKLNKDSFYIQIFLIKYFERGYEDLKEDIVIFEETLVKLDTDFIKGLIHSLELLDPKQPFFFMMRLKTFYTLAAILEKLEFNRNNYIINSNRKRL